jgi:tetratricopeptide (TPR) repeat protein
MSELKFDEVMKRLTAASEDAEALTLATMELVLGQARPEVQSAFEAAAIPHWFDAAILAHMLQVKDETANMLLEELHRLPMIESFAVRKGWNVHEATRLAVRARLAREQQDRFRRLSSRAAAFFQGEGSELVVERLFHQLVAEPDLGTDELYAVWMRWTQASRDQNLQALAVMLRELLEIPNLGVLSRGFASVCRGWIMQERLPQREIETLARNALGLFRQMDNAIGEAEARQLLGQNLEKRGSPDALGEYLMFKQIMQGLIQGDPDNTHWLWKLAVAHRDVGNVFQAQGQLPDALREFEASKQIMQRLTGDDPDKTHWQWELALAYRGVGDVFKAQGRLPDAVRECEASKQIMQRLIEGDRDNARWQLGLSVAHNRIGVLLHAQGQSGDALREFDAYKQIILRLNQSDPDNPSWERELSVVHNCVGCVFQAERRLPDALREFEIAKQIRLQLTRRDPDNADWQEDLSVAYNWVGSVFEIQGKLDDALQEFETSKEIMLRLTHLYPDNTDWQRELSVLHRRVGNVFQAQGQFGKALHEFEAFRRIMLRLTQRDPDNVDWQRGLSIAKDCVRSVLERKP